jgi:hypothetical protein
LDLSDEAADNHWLFDRFGPLSRKYDEGGLA